MKTALVFSAGGMFGAWQAGAWKTLAPRFKPDLVVGASIGSLNAWAVAGGCAPEVLEQYWLELEGGGALKMRLPRSPLDGWFDTRHFQRAIEMIYKLYTPVLDVAVVATDLLRLRPHIFSGKEITLDHLAASCALPFVLRQPRIGGRIYTDGGLLNALPVWAAVQLGARRIVALDSMPKLSFAPVRLANMAIRAAGRWSTPVSSNIEVVRIAPPSPLGGVREMIDWKRDRIARWIDLGEHDCQTQATRDKTFLSELF